MTVQLIGASGRVELDGQALLGSTRGYQARIRGGRHLLVVHWAGGGRPELRRLVAEFGEPLVLRFEKSQGAARAKRVERSNGLALEMGVGISLIADKIDQTGFSNTGQIALRAAFRHQRPRWAFEAGGLLLLAPQQADVASGAFLHLQAQFAAEYALSQRLFAGARFALGTAVIVGTDAGSPLFRGAVDVDGAFACFALRPELIFGGTLAHGVYLAGAVALDFIAKHADFAASVHRLLRPSLMVAFGWRG